jgi:hypothetical protein
VLDAADIRGLNDPGRLAPDKAADVIVFDMPRSGMPYARSAKTLRRSS